MRRKIKTHIARTLAILGLIILAFAAFPEMPNALGGMFLCGEDISSYNDNSWHAAGASGSPSIPGWSAGRFKLSIDRKTLYLDEFNYNHTGDSSLYIIEADHDLTVHVSGLNNLGDNSFITLSDFNGNTYYDLTLEGESNSSIHMRNPVMGNMIDVRNLTINGCEFVSQASPVYINGTITINSGGLFIKTLLTDSLIIKNGTVTADTEEKNAIAVTIKKSLKMEGGDLSAFPNREVAVPLGIYVYDNGSVTINGGEVICIGDLRVGELYDQAGASYTQTGGTVYSSRDVSVYGSMSLSGGSLNPVNGIYCSGKTSGTMNLAGNGSIRTKDINLSGKFTGTGGSVNATGELRLSGGMELSGASIEASSAYIVNKAVVTAGSLECNNTTQDGDALYFNSMELSGGKIIATSSSADNYAVYSSDSIIINGGSFRAVNDKGLAVYTGAFSMSGGTFYGSSGDNVNSGLKVNGSSPALSDGIWISAPDDGYIKEESYKTYQVYSSSDQPAHTAQLGKVDEISVDTRPTTVDSLYSGDSFDPAGLVLKVTFEDGSSTKLSYNDKHKDMFGFSISPRTELSYGDKQQTISCLGKRAFLNFTVKKIGTPQLSGSVSGRSALLSWTAGDGAHQYIVFVGETGSGSSRRVGTLTGTSFTHEGLEPGRSYDYTVYPSRNSNNGSETWGEQSNTLTLVVPLDTPQLTASAEGCDAASLSWNAVDGASGYVVYRQEGSGSFTEIKTTEDTSLDDTGLDTGTEYTYYVKAKHGSVVSTESNHETVTPAFTGSTTLTVSNNNPGYYLAWDAVNGASSYEIWRGDGENGEQSHIADIDTNAYTDISADSYSTYNYMVKPNRIVGGNTFYADNSNVAIGEALERPHEPEPETKPEPVIVPPPQDDPSGTEFGLLQARSTKVTKTSITIAWKKVEGAQNYVIYGNKCGTNNKYKKLTATTNLSLTFTNVAGNKLKKGTYYKFLVYAVDGKGKILSTSKTVHVATTGGKVGNDKAVRTAAKKNKVKKLKVKRHRKIAYETSNSNIATVSKKGVIKAKDKGVCYVYAYTQNGIFAKVKVTVK